MTISPSELGCPTTSQRTSVEPTRDQVSNCVTAFPSNYLGPRKTTYLIKGSQFTFTYFNEKESWLLSIRWFYPTTFVQKKRGLQHPCSKPTLDNLAQNFELQRTSSHFVDQPPPYQTLWHPVKLVAPANVVQHQHPVHTNRCPPARLDEKRCPNKKKRRAIQVISYTQQRRQETWNTICIQILTSPTALLYIYNSNRFADSQRVRTILSTNPPGSLAHGPHDAWSCLPRSTKKHF